MNCAVRVSVLAFDSNREWITRFMEQKSVLRCRDGRVYDLKMSWNENLKETENVFPILFVATDRSTGKNLRLPREIATFAIGDPTENIGQKIKINYGGQRQSMELDYLEMAYRRVTDWVERGK